MKKLNYNVSIHEISNVAKHICDSFSQSSINDGRLQSLMEAIRANNEALLEAMTPHFDRSNLDELDTIRDRYWIDLVHVLDGYRRLPIEPFRAAGEKLFQLADEFGASIARMSFAQESAALELVLKNLNETQYASSISCLPGVRELIGLLQQAQNDFHQAQMAFNRVQADQSNRVSPTNIKKELLTLINIQLIPYLNVMLAVDSATFQPLHDLIEETITEINGNVSRRK